MQVRSLGQEDPLEKETATHSIILAWTEEPMVVCSPWGCKGVRHNLSTKQQQPIPYKLEAVEYATLKYSSLA